MRLYKGLIIGVLFFITSVVADELRPLNILFVLNHFPAPSQTFILNIITGLIDSGHNVYIFSFKKDDFSDADMHPDIEQYNLMDRVIYEQFPIQLSECDIVFCQFGYVGKKVVELKSLKKWLKGKKVVVCFRGSDITSHVQKNPKKYKKLFKKGDLFLPVCDHFVQRLTQLGCNPKKIKVYHSAIDCSQFLFKTREKPEDDIIHLISVCRLVEKKGIDIALHAIAEVIKKYKQIHYTIVGDGPERAHLEELIQQLDIADNVTMYGWAQHQQVIEMLDNAHIFLLPSLKAANGNEEGIPNALKEAMAMGLITVGTWHAGTPELIEDGILGFLVPEKDSAQLAEIIEHIIENPEIWQKMQRAARRKVEDEFEIKKSIAKLETLFYGLLHSNQDKTKENNIEENNVTE